jgi:general secretion pathway protein B
MSYILEALRKSDQQRQRDAAPRARLAQAPVPASRRPPMSVNILLAAALLAAGIAIGGWRPWHTDSSPVAATATTTPSPPAAAPLRQATLPTPPVQANAPQADTPAAPPEPQPAIAPTAPSQPAADKPGGEAPSAGISTLAEVPPTIREQLPALKIAMHAYSNNAADSVVMIDSQLFHEGDMIAPGVKLERITPTGLVIDYRGYRISRPVH